MWQNVCLDFFQPLPFLGDGVEEEYVEEDVDALFSGKLLALAVLIAQLATT